MIDRRARRMIPKVQPGSTFRIAWRQISTMAEFVLFDANPGGASVSLRPGPEAAA
jgi:hypothetical protein